MQDVQYVGRDFAIRQLRFVIVDMITAAHDWYRVSIQSWTNPTDGATGLKRVVEDVQMSFDGALGIAAERALADDAVVSVRLDGRDWWPTADARHDAA